MYVHVYPGSLHFRTVLALPLVHLAPETWMIRNSYCKLRKHFISME